MVSGSVVATRVSTGRPDGVIVLDAVNRGDADANPEGQPVTVADTLPPGLEAVAIEGTVGEKFAPAALQVMA